MQTLSLLAGICPLDQLPGTPQRPLTGLRQASVHPAAACRESGRLRTDGRHHDGSEHEGGDQQKTTTNHEGGLSGRTGKSAECSRSHRVRLITRIWRSGASTESREDYRSRNVASNVSRRASPTKLNASTVNITMSPAG